MGLTRAPSGLSTNPPPSPHKTSMNLHIFEIRSKQHEVILFSKHNSRHCVSLLFCGLLNVFAAGSYAPTLYLQSFLVCWQFSTLFANNNLQINMFVSNPSTNRHWHEQYETSEYLLIDRWFRLFYILFIFMFLVIPTANNSPSLVITSVDVTFSPFLMELIVYFY